MSYASKIPLFTSIPPRVKRLLDGRDYGAAWQMACIESWRQSRFLVISLNSAAELTDLTHSYPAAVDFIELPPGVERPRIVDFFDAAKESGAATAGIINADCLMIPQTGLAERLAENLKSVVIVERINLDRQTLRPTGHHCYGFDAFFFPIGALSALKPDESWRIGDTWWDYWLPIAFHLGGVELRTLPAPMLVHLDHELVWNKEGWIEKCLRLLEYVRDGGLALDDPELAAAFVAMSQVPEELEIYGFSERLFAWLRAREPLWRPEAVSIDDLFVGILNGLATPAPLTAQPASGRENSLRRALSWLGASRRS
jgi:hypothetical protein